MAIVDKSENTVNNLRNLPFTMDGWMTCDFTSFLTIFQSYQHGG